MDWKNENLFLQKNPSVGVLQLTQNPPLCVAGYGLFSDLRSILSALTLFTDVLHTQFTQSSLYLLCMFTHWPDVSVLVSLWTLTQSLGCFLLDPELCSSWESTNCWIGSVWKCLHYSCIEEVPLILHKYSYLFEAQTWDRHYVALRELGLHDVNRISTLQFYCYMLDCSAFQFINRPGSLFSGIKKALAVLIFALLLHTVHI